jgi:hypothetical protein
MFNHNFNFSFQNKLIFKEPLSHPHIDNLEKTNSAPPQANDHTLDDLSKKNNRIAKATARKTQDLSNTLKEQDIARLNRICLIMPTALQLNVLLESLNYKYSILEEANKPIITISTPSGPIAMEVNSKNRQFILTFKGVPHEFTYLPSHNELDALSKTWLKQAKGTEGVNLLRDFGYKNVTSQLVNGLLQYSVSIEGIHGIFYITGDTGNYLLGYQKDPTNLGNITLLSRALRTLPSPEKVQKILATKSI